MIEKQKSNNVDQSRFKIPANPFSNKTIHNQSKKRKINMIQNYPQSKQRSADNSTSSAYGNVSKKLKTSSTSSNVKSVFFANNLNYQKQNKISEVSLKKLYTIVHY